MHHLRVSSPKDCASSRLWCRLYKFVPRPSFRVASGSAVRVVTGDGMEFDDTQRYDVVVLTASLPIYDSRFERALRSGGRLFVVVGDAAPQRACLVRSAGDGDSASETLFETSIEALEGASRPTAFCF